MPLRPVGTFSAYTNIIPSGSGYFAQGYSSSIFTGADKLNFNTESISTITSIFTAGAPYFNAGVSNIGTAGYVSKGRDSLTRNLEKLAFSSDTVTQTSSTLSTASYGWATMSNNGVAGYYTGGTSGGRSSTAVDKITYSNDTTSVSTNLINGNYYHSAFSNSGIAGYATGISLNTVNKNSFPTDTMSSVAAPSTFQEYRAAYFSNTGVAGYAATGGAPSILSIYKWSFTSESYITVSSTLSQARNYTASISHSQYAGYVGGGALDSLVQISAIDKIAFNSDTTSVLSSTLSSNKAEMSGLNNGGIV